MMRKKYNKYKSSREIIIDTGKQHNKNADLVETLNTFALLTVIY